MRQHTNASWNLTREQVMRHIELLQANGVSNCVRYGTKKLIKADVEHRQVLQKPNLRRQARSECVVHQNDLVQVGHVPQARRNAAVEPVVGEDDDGDRRVAEVVRKIKYETVVVDENGVQILIEQLSRHRSFEFVEPEIQELE